MKNIIKIMSMAVVCFMMVALCSVTVKAASEAEGNNKFDTANQIPVNEAVKGSLMDSNDKDYFKLSLKEAGYIEIMFERALQGNANTYWRVHIYDAKYNEFTTYEFKGNVAKETVDPVGLPAGNYYVMVEDYYYSSDPYELTVKYTVSDAWETESNNTFDKADSVKLNKTFHGSLMDSNDKDYYKLSLEKPGYIEITFERALQGNMNTYWKAHVYNEEYREFTCYEFKGNSEKDTRMPIGLPAGIYYILVENYYYSSDPYAMTVKYEVSDAWESEFNNTFDAADLIAVNKTFHGSLMDSNDKDYFKISLDQAGYIEIMFERALQGNANTYWKAHIYDGAYKELTTYEFKGNVGKDLMAPIGLPSGIYYVFIENYYSSATPYELTVKYTNSDAWETEFNNTFDAADTIVADKTFHGSLMNSDDKDFFKISLDKAAYFKVKFEHPLQGNTNTYWKMHIYDEKYNKLTTYELQGNKEKETISPIGLSAGNYYFSVESYYHSSDPYAFTLQKIISVTGVSLDQTTLSLAEDQTAALKATVAPANADDTSVMWTSSDTKVVTVNAGTVKAVAPGTATVTVKTTDGGYTAQCRVTVTKKNGWITVGGINYWYEDGVKQGTVGRGKEIYDPGTDAWYWLDAVQGGAVAKSKDVYMDSDAGVFADNPDGTGKWVRYDADGHMVKGWNEKDGKKYYFDSYSGAMAKGIIVMEGTAYEFDTETGEMTGSFQVDSGFRMTGWNQINGVDYWFESGVKQGVFGRGKEIYDPDSDAWYWLDAIDGGKKAVSKDVYQESLAGEWGDQTNQAGEKIGKWVRYDENGHMVKGWSADGKYYFDPVFGTMAKGEAVINGVTYFFDKKTGERQ